MANVLVMVARFKLCTLGKKDAHNIGVTFSWVYVLKLE